MILEQPKLPTTDVAADARPIAPTSIESDPVQPWRAAKYVAAQRRP